MAQKPRYTTLHPQHDIIAIYNEIFGERFRGLTDELLFQHDYLLQFYTFEVVNSFADIDVI